MKEVAFRRPPLLKRGGKESERGAGSWLRVSSVSPVKFTAPSTHWVRFNLVLEPKEGLFVWGRPEEQSRRLKGKELGLLRF